MRVSFSMRIALSYDPQQGLLGTDYAWREREVRGDERDGAREEHVELHALGERQLQLKGRVGDKRIQLLRELGLSQPIAEDRKPRQSLGELLFAEPVGEAGRELLEKARHVGERLWIRVKVEDSSLRLLAWEAAALPGELPDAPGTHLWEQDDTFVVRDGNGPALRPVARVRVQALIAAEKDGKAVREAYQKLRNPEGFDFLEPLIAQEWETIKAQLHERRPHVLIYLGHVEPKKADEPARMSLIERGVLPNGHVYSDTFAALLSELEDLQVLVLAGCATWSRVAQEDPIQKLPVVLAFSSPDEDCTEHAKSLSEVLPHFVEGQGDILELYAAWRRASCEHGRPESPVLIWSGERHQLLGEDQQTRAILAYCESLRVTLNPRRDGRRERSLFLERTLTHEKQPEQPRLTLSQQRVLDNLSRHSPLFRGTADGPPGMGKSELLRHFTWVMAGDYAKDPLLARVPVLVTLREYDWDWLRTQLGSVPNSDLIYGLLSQAVQGKLTDRAILEELCASGRLVLLIDGWDEVRPAEVRERLARTLEEALRAPSGPIRKCAILLGGRTTEIQNLRFDERLIPRDNRLQFEGFKPVEIERYIKQRYFAGAPRGTEICAALRQSDRTMRMARTPLFLRLLCQVCETDNFKVPTSEVELMGAALEDLFERRHVSEDDREALKLVLARLAWAVTERGDEAPNLTRGDVEDFARALRASTDWPAVNERLSFWEEVEQQRAVVDQSYKPDVLRSWLQPCGVVYERASLYAASRSYGFSEERIREWLAGWWLAQQRDDFIIEQFGWHAWNPDWDEVIFWMAGELWNSHTPKHLLEDVGPNRRPLARRLVEWLLNEEDAGHGDRFATLETMASRLLGEAATHDDGEVQLLQRLACLAIRIPHTEEAVAAMIGVLQDSRRRYLWAHAVVALGRLGAHSAEAIAVLIGVVRDWRMDSDVKYYAERALARLDARSEEAVAALIGVLQDPRKASFWMNAANALARRGAHSEEAGAALIGVLKDPQKVELWDRAAEALEELGAHSDEAVAALIGVLQDPWQDLGDPWRQNLWAGAVYALGRLGARSEEAVATLIDVLRDPQKVELWTRTARQLAILGAHSDEAVTVLIGVLKDPQKVELWDRAAEALKELGAHSDEAVAVLIGVLEDSRRQYLWDHAVVALGELGAHSDEAVAALIGVLQDPWQDLGDPWWQNLWAGAVYALGRLGARSEEAVATLIDVLRDPQKVQLWTRTARQLAILGAHSDEAVTVLIGVLKDPQKVELWTVAACALEEFGAHSDEAVAVLIGVLQDSRRQYLWDHAVVALGKLGAHSEEAVAVLIGVLQDSRRQYLWDHAVVALGRLGAHSEEAVAALIGVLQDPQKESLWIAALAELVDLGDLSLAPEPTSVRQYFWAQAVAALTRLGAHSEEAVAVLIGVLQDSRRYYLWKEAVRALGSLGARSEEAVAVLIGVLQDSQRQDLWDGAVAALTRLGTHSEEAVAALIGVLQDPQYVKLWNRAAGALATLGAHSDEAVAALIGVLQDPQKEELWTEAAWAIARFALDPGQTITNAGFVRRRELGLTQDRLPAPRARR